MVRKQANSNAKNPLPESITTAVLASVQGVWRTANGFIFKCSDLSESECLSRALFGTDKIAGDEVLSLHPRDRLFLLNVESDKLIGIYEAKSEGKRSIVPEAWKGHYPYQIEVQPLGPMKVITNAKAILSVLGLNSHTLLYDFEVDALNTLFCSVTPHGLHMIDEALPDTFIRRVAQELASLRKIRGLSSPECNKPKLESTTLWDYPKQSYGCTPKGNNKYAGVTPAFIIYNLVKRYTEPGDLVVDPMCGSGTTIDVCREEGRRVIGYDIVSVRPDILENDARHIPLEDNSVDLIFIDSPYGDNIKYNNSPESIGNISAETEEFYEELEKVMKESWRVLKPGKVLGWLIGDQWVKKSFTPVGFKVYERLTKHFEPVDVICVTRRSQSSNTSVWHNRAIRFNFYLRGFKYLHIMRKPIHETKRNDGNRSVKWAYYDRGKRRNTGEL